MIDTLNFHEKLKSSIIGFTVGDALGVPVEFKSREDLQLKPIDDMEGEGTHYQPKGTWSDDTSMILATLDCNSLYDFEELADKFVNWYKKCDYTPYGKVFDIGNTTSLALNKWRTSVNNPTECGSVDINSNGNGSLMRILPYAFSFYGLGINSLSTRIERVNKCSKITHAHHISTLACNIYSEIVQNLLSGDNIETAYNKIRSIEWFKMEQFLVVNEYTDEVINNFDRILKNDISELKMEEIKSSGYVIDTLEAVLWCVLKTNNYKEAVLKAVNLGNDTDTIAALVGGLAGIMYGYDSIPTNWIDCLAKKEYLFELIEKFEQSIELL
jgi:ADP-ribosylglycohydrolase